MKKLFALIMALVMVFSLAACGSSDSNATDDKVYTVSLQFTFPETNCAPLQAVLDEMEEASNGRLKFEVYYSSSMVANADIIDALQAGTLSVAGVMPAEHSILQLNGRLSGVPFLGYESYEAANDIFLNVLWNNEDMLAEYSDNGLVLWAASMCPGYQFYTTTKIDEADPSLFAGLTIMTENAEMQSFVSSNGGASVAAYPPDFYANLSNGVCEGLVQHLNCLTAFGCVELIETAVFFGEGGFYNYPIVYCMGEDFWNSLPEDLQQIFIDYSAAYSAASFNNDKDQYDGNLANMEAAGVNMIMMTEAEIAEWQEAFQPVLTQLLSSMNNDAAESVYQQFVDTIASYDADTFVVGANNFGVEYSR